MPTIDVQVHSYERNHPGRPWQGHLAGPDSVTGEEMIAAMDAVGVDAAILVSPYSLYKFDPSYALSVRAKYPKRFAVIKPVDTTNPAIDDVVADWKRTEGTIGIRIMLRETPNPDPADPGPNRTLAAAAKHGLPVNMLCWGRMEQADGLMARNPDTVMVIDHLGLAQPFHPPVPAEPWAALPTVLAMAKYPNVRIKVSGACTLSHQKFPYPDIWDPILRVIDAFGLDRCMWGTDWTRATELLTYRDGVEAFRVTDRLSAADKERLMGGTLQKVYNWTPR